jgi:hypothetical protein
MTKKRPLGVTLFLWMVLTLSGFGFLRLYGALGWRDVLREFRSSLSPLYLSITGAGWVLAGAVLLWSIWTGRRWAYPAVPLSIAVWLVEYWIERIFFEAPRANLPFMIVISILLLVITVACAQNQKTKNFLRKSEEYEQPESNSISK